MERNGSICSKGKISTAAIPQVYVTVEVVWSLKNHSHACADITMIKGLNFRKYLLYYLSIKILE